MKHVRRVMAGAVCLAILLTGCGLTPDPVITTESLRDGTVGAQYGQSITVTGDGSGGGILRTARGLPPGLTVPSPDQGAITGTPTQAGDFNVTLSAWNEGAGNGASKTLPLTIFPALSITTQTLPSGQVGVPYDAAIATQGGKAPMTFFLSGSLPSGLSFDTATGVISGTPTQSGPSGALAFVAHDANGANTTANLTIGIAP